MADVAPVRLKAPPAVTVVVPTRNEADNVRPLVEQLREALGATPGEIVFVDDSDDHTPRAIAALSERDPEGVRLIHRTGADRTGGLGGAVTAGLAAARAPWVVVMDGDLQHPPATVPELLAAGQVDQADAVVASRYRTRGRVTGLGGAFRRVVSRASGTLARIFFPVRLRAVTDPMSGFFAVRRDALDITSLRPNGYKILLEVVVRGRMRQISEVPYTFQPRQSGESKASFREGLRYLRHLTLLRLGATRHPASPLGRFAGFALAGAIGTAVNSAALWALGVGAGLPYLLAAFLAVQVAIVWNFAVIDNLVMPPGEHARRRRFGRFLLLNNTLTPVHLGLLYGLVQLAGLHYLEANVLAVVAVFVLRYAVTSNWVYGAPAGAGGLVLAVRRAVATRLLLAVALTAVAFPALTAGVWDGLWSRGPGVPLLIPVAAAAALAASRIRPDGTEPDVHDRQVDGLLATVFLTAGATLLLLMPAGGWLLPAALSFLAGAAILLVGTRTVARLRWALLLPLVAVAVAVPALRESVDAGIRAVVTLLGRPAGPTSSGGGLVTAHQGTDLLLPAQQLPGLALAGGVACLLIVAAVRFGPTGRALARGAVASLVLAAVTVGTVLAVMLTGRLFGPAAFEVARLPVVTDAVLALTVAVVVTRWSPRSAPAGAVRQYLPRGRFALAALLAMAVVLLGSAR